MVVYTRTEFRDYLGNVGLQSPALWVVKKVYDNDFEERKKERKKETEPGMRGVVEEMRRDLKEVLLEMAVCRTGARGAGFG